MTKNTQDLDLSVLLLAQNEEETIARSITSIKTLNPKEIVVIDDESTDHTGKIAHSLGARVIRHKKEDFAEARNFGLQNTTSAWVLYVDADEEISQELRSDIVTHLSSNLADAYRIRRVNEYLGKKWPHTEQVPRLFKRTALIQWYGKVHESPRIHGKIAHLHGALYHYTHRSLTEMVHNTVMWSGIEAKLRYDAHHPPVVWWRIPRVMLPTFWDYYIRQKGYTVGTVGLIESMYQAFSIFITYARLWELSRGAVAPKIHKSI